MLGVFGLEIGFLPRLVSTLTFFFKSVLNDLGAIPETFPLWMYQRLGDSKMQQKKEMGV